MTSWDRRVAAATRQRDNTDPEFIDERLRALGLPETIHPDDKVAVLTLLRVADARANNFGATVLGRVAEGDGSIRTIRIVVLGNDNGATILVGDGDPELKLELDRLTGLPGRTYLLEMLDDALQQSLGADHLVGVFTVDIDRFKTVNDSRGFAKGDDALRRLATRLEDVLRPDDVLTRMSGDEFTVLCPDVFGPAEAMEIAEQLRLSCNDVDPDSPLNGVTLSVGVAVGGADRNGEDLVREAETALYRAKGLGRDRCELFDDTLRTIIERRITVDQRLRHALDNDAIHVHYQPIVEVESRRIVGAEALLRIINDDGSYLDPLELVESAEDSGLIGRIESTVLERAARTIRELTADDADDPIFLSVNVSESRFTDSRFPLELARTLHQADLPAERLHLEIDSSFLAEGGAATRLGTQLRTLGVGVTIDEYLGANDGVHVDGDTVDFVKLDKRLVHGIHSERGRTRADLVVGVLRDRDIDVCAVGVETDDDLTVIAEIGCRLAQGYLFSPPVDGDRLRELVAEGTL
mgnify:CR=1 FL=1